MITEQTRPESKGRKKDLVDKLKIEMNCSSESTVQNNSYKLSSSQISKPPQLTFDFPVGEPVHFRKRSEVNYNFFMNKNTSAFDPKSCKSNNISFHNNESLNSSIRKRETDRKMSKLEKYFKNLNTINGPLKIQCANKSSSITNALSKNSLVCSNLYEQFGKNFVSSPKGVKERGSFKQSSSINKSNLLGSNQRLSTVSKSQAVLEKVDLTPLFWIEDFLYQFLVCVHKEADIYNVFKHYIEFVQDQNFEVFLDQLEIPMLFDSFKNALILERMSLMISFYLSLNGFYKKEIVFLRKVAALIYSNLFLFVKILFKDLAGSDLTVSSSEVSGQACQNGGAGLEVSERRDLQRPWQQHLQDFQDH